MPVSELIKLLGDEEVKKICNVVIITAENFGLLSCSLNGRDGHHHIEDNIRNAGDLKKHVGNLTARQLLTDYPSESVRLHYLIEQVVLPRTLTRCNPYDKKPSEIVRASYATEDEFLEMLKSS